VLAGVVVREILAGRNWRNLPMIAAVSVLGIADLLMHLEAIDVLMSGGQGWRLGLAAVIVLISVIGGRIVPVFTRNASGRRLTDWPTASRSSAAGSSGPVPASPTWRERRAIMRICCWRSSASICRGARLRGLSTSHPDWIRASRTRGGLRARWQALFQDVDVVLCPAMPTPAFPHDYSQQDQRQIDVDGQKVPYDDQIAWARLAPSTAQ
jgi:hypothetical protein